MAIKLQESEKKIGHNDSLESKSSRLVVVSAIDGHPMDGISGQGSPFTNSLIKTLLENDQESLSASELIVSLRKAMFESTKKNKFHPQSPALGVLRDTTHEGGEFCFKIKEEFIKNEENTTSETSKKSNDDVKLEEILQKSLEKLKEEFTKVVETNNDKLEDRMIKLEKSKVAEKSSLNKKELLRLIKEDKIENFFNKIDEVQDEIEESQIVDLINLQSQWRGIENQRRLGIIDFSNESVTKNKLRKSIIEITNSIKKR